MSYFFNPKTEEELKGQYRKLLIKYEYRSDKNQAIIADISREYKKLSLQLKGKGIKEAAKAFSDGYHTARVETARKEEAERKRVNNLRNRCYTNQEIQFVLTELHKHIDTILKQVVFDNKSPYRSLSNTAARLDETHLCRWFHSHLDIMASQSLVRKYDTIREKVEYGLKGRANQNQKSEEAFISAYEKSLGQYMQRKLHEYEDLYMDPLEIVERVQGAKKQSRFDNLFIRLQMGMVGVTLVIIGVCFGAIAGRGSLLNILVGGLIGVFIGMLIYKKSVSALIGLNKKSLYTSGMHRKKSRVSEKGEYTDEKAKFAIVRFLSHLFR